MNTNILKNALQETRKAFPGSKPKCAVILGSGWGTVTGSFKAKKSLNYSDIPGLGMPGVEGHAGELVLAEFAGMQILVFQGRRHFYEGTGWESVAIPVYLSVSLGATDIILTNAAGGIRDDLKPGTLMIIDDHINAMGSNPLIGNTDTFWGPRFADQTHVYNPELREMLGWAAHRTGITVSHGIYAGTTGPTYETPAEIRALMAMGADAVGMSTVPEAILANAAGMRVAGISCITNAAAHACHDKLSHKEVVDTAAKAQPEIQTLLTEILKDLSTHVFNANSNAR